MNTFNLPDGYKKICDIDLRKKKPAILVNGIAVVIMLSMVIIAIVVHSFEFDIDKSIFVFMLPYIALIPISILYFVLHELVHGIFIRIFSKQKAKYGFTGLYAFAGSDAYFDRKSYIIITLAPIVIWGIVLLVINIFVKGNWFWTVYLTQVMNISGAAGDMYVTLKMLKMPKDVLTHDQGTSMEIFSKE